MPILDPTKLKDGYDEAHTAMKSFWDSFDEYERIARNKPHPKVVAAKLPTVTDGTLAGVITSQPKRVIQRIPTGSIKSVDQPELAEMANFIWEHEIIPNANTGGDFIQKSWVAMAKSLTYGMQPAYCFFKNSGDYYGADFSLPYIRDLILQRGKVYGPDCECLWLRQWYTPEQIQMIIDKEKKLTNDSKSGWDIGALKALMKQKKEKDADARTPNERDKSPTASYVEIVHAFQVGVGAKFYSFAPDLPAGENVVRTKVNPDPRGKMPITFLYADIDLSNPLGRGYVELSGGMQNLIDSEVQSYQLIQKLMLNPPVMKWGDSIRGSTIKFKPNAVWDMGSDANSKIETVNLNNEAISNFVNNYSLMKSQILNLTNNQDSGVSTEAAGATSQSKTSKGVAQQQQRIGFSDTYMRKQFEAWFQDTAECMLNIHFAESSGEREIALTEDYIANITPADANQPQQPPMQSPNGLVSVDPMRQQAVVAYNAIKTKLKFTVDPTSSELPDDQTQVENLNELLQSTSSNPYIYYYLLQDGYRLNLGEAYKQLFTRLGVEEIDKIISKNPDNQSDLPNQLRGVMNPLYDKPTVNLKYTDLPPAGQIQAAANAGITLTPADVLAGPVVDPNIRGVEAPVTDTTAQMPIPNPAYGQHAPDQIAPTPGAPGTAAPTPSQGPPGAAIHPGSAGSVDAETGHIAPAPTPPQPAAAAAPPPATQPTTQVQPAQPPQQAAPQAPVQPAQPQQQLSPEDQQLAVELLKAGYSSEQAMNAIVLLNHGYTHDQILQALGPPQGQANGQ